MRNTNPYSEVEDRGFWKRAVSEVHIADWSGLTGGVRLDPSAKIATAGSCFAQHIGEHLRLRGANYMDVEPDPGLFRSRSEARTWGFGVYSARYGNIYTSRQLIQLFDEAFGERQPAEIVWEKNGRFYDALRPSVDPVGQDSPDAVVELRLKHLERVREMFATLDVFVFTMGLTEGWELRKDKTMYPVAPGTIAGSYRRSKYRFRNLNYREIMNDMLGFWDRLKNVNPTARLLLTISPVPLVATASGKHVLLATTYSKSVLRAVAGDLSDQDEKIIYFPSYELISSHPTRGMFFNPDLRTVNRMGVEFVMSHFFSSLFEGFVDRVTAPDEADDSETSELICDEEALDERRLP